jgi:hypothetical protein
MQRDVEVDVPHESIEPHGRHSLNELVDEWDRIRQNMRVLLEEIEADTQADMVYRHPYAGPLNLAETLEFIDIHLANHVRHIDVILARIP